MRYQTDPPRYIAKIQRNDYKRRLICWLFRRYVLNLDRYHTVCKFTGPRPKGTSQVSTIKANATAFRYYFNTRPRIRRHLWEAARMHRLARASQ